MNEWWQKLPPASTWVGSVGMIQTCHPDVCWSRQMFPSSAELFVLARNQFSSSIFQFAVIFFPLKLMNFCCSAGYDLICFLQFVGSVDCLFLWLHLKRSIFFNYSVELREGRCSSLEGEVLRGISLGAACSLAPLDMQLTSSSVAAPCLKWGGGAVGSGFPCSHSEDFTNQGTPLFFNSQRRHSCAG